MGMMGVPIPLTSMHWLKAAFSLGGLISSRRKQGVRGRALDGLGQTWRDPGRVAVHVTLVQARHLPEPQLCPSTRSGNARWLTSLRRGVTSAAAAESRPSCVEGHAQLSVTLRGAGVANGSFRGWNGDSQRLFYLGGALGAPR